MNPSDIPDHEIDALARCLLPAIQAYFDSLEGQAEFERWKAQQQSTQLDINDKRQGQ